MDKTNSHEQGFKLPQIEGNNVAEMGGLRPVSEFLLKHGNFV